MFFPISDSPNPKGIPWATWTIIALNILIFLVINLPLSTQPADVNAPAYREYMQFLSQYASSPDELAAAAQQVSSYDVFVFEHGYRPAQGSVMDLVFSMFLHGPLRSRRASFSRSTSFSTMWFRSSSPAVAGWRTGPTSGASSPVRRRPL